MEPPVSQDLRAATIRLAASMPAVPPLAVRSSKCLLLWIGPTVTLCNGTPKSRLP